MLVSYHLHVIAGQCVCLLQSSLVIHGGLCDCVFVLLIALCNPNIPLSFNLHLTLSLMVFISVSFSLLRYKYNLLITNVSHKALSLNKFVSAFKKCLTIITIVSCNIHRELFKLKSNS